MASPTACDRRACNQQLKPTLAGRLMVQVLLDGGRADRLLTRARGICLGARSCGSPCQDSAAPLPWGLDMWRRQRETHCHQALVTLEGHLKGRLQRAFSPQEKEPRAHRHHREGQPGIALVLHLVLTAACGTHPPATNQFIMLGREG